MSNQDIYIKVSDPSGLHGAIVSHHRVWDRQRFLSAQIKAHSNADNEADRRTVTVASQREYRTFNGYKPEHCHD
jgi:hypothetical protein